MDRRTLLAWVGGVAVAGLGGCLDSPDSATTTEHHAEVTVQNNHDRAYEARIVLTDASGSTVHDSTFTLQPGEGRAFADDYPPGTYTLEIALSDRAALRSHWDTALCDVLQVRAAVEADGRVVNAVRCADRTTTA